MSVSSHNVGLPALEVRRPECTGYLLKVGNRRKTWHRRYCILKDACLYYYKNMNSLSALGQYAVVSKSFLLCYMNSLSALGQYAVVSKSFLLCYMNSLSALGQYAVVSKSFLLCYMNSLSALGQYGVVHKSFLLCFNVDIHREVDRDME